jgi:Luciferase-like monooxygenase
MKKIGFLSFGHWTPSSQSQTRSAADTLLQSIDLAVAAEELGADGAYFRVHHFARQLASPFPVLAVIGAKTSRIEIGTAVIDMRYENPFYMAEDAGGRRSHRRRTPSARHQQRIARAGDRWLAVFRLSTGRRRERRRHGTASCGGLLRPAAR